MPATPFGVTATREGPPTTVNSLAATSMDLLKLETVTLWAALIGYSLSTIVAIFALVLRKWPERTLLALLAMSWGLHTASTGTRWARLEHLPVGNIFEMLSANIWGLMLAVLVGYWLLPRIRPFVAVVLPIVVLLLAWILLIPTRDSLLPPTYDTVWLYVHIAFIKLFLGSAFVALGIAGVILLRAAHLGGRFARMPADAVLDETANRCMSLALIFDTLGITAGAIWAQDAWGRYWSWDKLETWSLLTWLTIGATLHIRASFKTRPLTNSLLIVGVWLAAFFTFFGIPFVSTALHKGQI